MTEMQTTRLAADIGAGVDARLRLLGLVRGQRRIGRLLTDVLDKALPSADELTARLQSGPGRTCRHCGRPIAQSGPSGLWWAVDDIPAGEAPDCAHEPSQAPGGARHDAR